MPLAALQQKFPGLVQDVNVVTMQAISGGGYPGVPSLDILDNVVPYISGEEEKMEWETLKILGRHQSGSEIQHASYTVTASCNRVAVIDGHLACVTLLYDRSVRQPSVAELSQCFSEYTPLKRSAELPSAPLNAIYIHTDEDRPQPRLDRELDGGYAVSLGRLREITDNQGQIRGVKFVCLVHNTVLGAAGMGILNAELAIQKGYIKPVSTKSNL